jgi:1,2-dihydroxy-3-keto-5-methylthiopentene dioxygenase
MQATWVTPTDKPCSPEELRAEGIHLEQFEPQAMEPGMVRVKQQRGLTKHELVFMTTDNPKHEAAIAKEADEHAHMADEVRLIVEGEGIYEVRAQDDRWIRIAVGPGDLVVVPAKRYHRFLLGGSAVQYQQIYQDLAALMPFYRVSNDETRAV